MIDGEASNASWIRPAETAARGYIMKTLANSMNENSAWKIYSINEIKSPTCNAPASI
uniref:hypothetical protein n=1 Tax=Enterococcus durans TaxID=53345 RepID=UPI0038560504